MRRSLKVLGKRANRLKSGVGITCGMELCLKVSKFPACCLSGSSIGDGKQELVIFLLLLVEEGRDTGKPCLAKPLKKRAIRFLTALQGLEQKEGKVTARKC